jgi:hypothetical protein
MPPIQHIVAIHIINSAITYLLVSNKSTHSFSISFKRQINISAALTASHNSSVLTLISTTRGPFLGSQHTQSSLSTVP